MKSVLGLLGDLGFVGARVPRDIGPKLFFPFQIFQAFPSFSQGFRGLGFPGLFRFSKPRDAPGFFLVFPRIPNPRGNPKAPRLSKFSFVFFPGFRSLGLLPRIPALSRFSKPRAAPRFSLAFPRIPRPRGTPRVPKLSSFSQDFLAKKYFPGFAWVFPDFLGLGVHPGFLHFFEVFLVFLRISKPRNSRTFQVFQT